MGGGLQKSCIFPVSIPLDARRRRPVPRRAEIDAIHQRLVDGVDFAELAASVSETGTKSDGGRLGPLRRSDLVAALADPAFTVRIGGVSEVIERPYGFHIIKVVGRQDDRVRSLEEVRPEVRQKLEDEKYFAELKVFMKKARSEAEWCV